MSHSDAQPKQGQLPHPSNDDADDIVDAHPKRKPAISHPNFDPKQTPLNPARPLSDIPEPVRRDVAQLRKVYGGRVHFDESHIDKSSGLSKWALVQSEALAEHIELMTAGQLAHYPSSFYQNNSEQPLLAPLADMRLLDLSDIDAAIRAYPSLTRHGIQHNTTDQNKTNSPSSKSNTSNIVTPDADELLNSVYAADWEVLLYPERFDAGMGSLATDILPCSVALHALTQCPTRQSINTSYSAEQICQHLRSYLLSECRHSPTHQDQYRQIRLFAGHVIVAAHVLGWDIQVSDATPTSRSAHPKSPTYQTCYFNMSSRCGLLARYPNMTEYDINGWSSA